MIRFFIAVCLTVVFACQNKQSPNKFSDAMLVRIADFQDRRLSDSLYQFFSHENPVYRRDAILAFASIQDTSAVAQLGKMLSDSHAEVRAATAFALGQIGTEKAYWALMDGFVSEKLPAVQAEIIESLGKASVRGKNPGPIQDQQDTVFQSAFAWSYYRLGLRNQADSMTVIRAAEILEKSPSERARLGAAHFFMRGPSSIASAEAILNESAANDRSPYVRMACVSALRKIKTATAQETIKKILENDPDYRVRVNAVRALQQFPITDTYSKIIQALTDSDVQVQVAASEVVKAVATRDQVSSLIPLAQSATNWRVQGNLYEALLTASNNKEIAEEIFRLYGQVENPYAKAALISALGKSTLAFDFVSEQLQTAQVPVIKSSAAGALVSINRHAEFSTALRPRFAELYRNAFETGDPAVIGTIASALADSTLGYKGLIQDFTFLYEARKRLSLPKDNEALQPLESAIAYVEGRKLSEPVKNEFNHAIDWNFVKGISKDQRVRIQTSKGDIVLILLVEEAPGSVANFVQLVSSGYFNSKNFHRVVPNFVIQGGCNRGDGWGSEDYSIRSEFSMRRYAEGSVGMASTGKDTEGTQWFITHSPTPHLDGRYTIFAVVEKGMDVVHRIEVGDTIVNAQLLK